MTTAWRIALIGMLAVLVFDTLASLASRSLGFPYAKAAIGSFVIYAAVGFAAGRVAPIATAAGIAAVVGLVEATAGWWLSWQIGPGRISSGALSATMAIRTIIIVMLTAGFIGAIAGVLARAYGAAVRGSV